MEQMSDESPDKRGEAAWKQQRDEISRRNAEAHKRAEVLRRERVTIAAGRARQHAEQEAEQLRQLNARISKKQA
jgi:hypothetical protein